MAITVILTANCLGRSISIRIKNLEDFSLLIMSIKTYIGFSKAPITQIMRKLENEQNFSRLGFLPSLNEKLDNGRDFYEAWCESLSEIGINLADTELLQAFAESLGGSDVNGQLENCDMFLNLIEARLQSLRPKAETRIKVCNSLGVLLAGLAVIILI